MYDIHTHLYWHTYDADRDAVIQRARKAGVEKMFVIGCTTEESKQAIALAEQYRDMYVAVGVHPHFFNDAVEKEFANPKPQSGLGLGMAAVEQSIAELRVLASHEKVIAIGECGLEYYVHPGERSKEKGVSEEQKEVQKRGFLVQIALAQELGFPLIVHCRPSNGSDDAYRDLLALLQTTNYSLPTILHCYMGDTEVTKEFLKLPKVYFSFTGNITYPVKQEMRSTKHDLRETVKMVPLERVFTETDCPFLAPQSHRGERNEPAFVSEVVAKIAKLQGISVETVAHAIKQNFQEVFSLN